MTDGLITRIGKWLDRIWQEKATEGQLQETQRIFNERIDNVHMLISRIDVTDLKTRLEKIELYAGMTRKVDPTKPAIAKSAFSM